MLPASSTCYALIIRTIHIIRETTMANDPKARRIPMGTLAVCMQEQANVSPLVQVGPFLYDDQLPSTNNSVVCWSI